MLALSESKQNRLIYVCFIMYTSVYLAKLNYNALLVEILADLGGTRSAAGMVGSFFFFSYGIGQVVNGFLVKRMNEKIVMTASLLGSAVCNFAMSFATDISIMKYIWLLNGIALSPLWCSVIKVQGKYISGGLLPKSLSVIGLTTSIGTAVNYGICALVAQFTTWRASFWFSGSLMAVMAVMWYINLNDIEHSTQPIKENKEKTASENISSKSSVKALGAASIICLAVMFITGATTQFAREGLNSWVPSILYEVYGMPTTLSIALTLIIPLLGTVSNTILVWLERKSKDFLVFCIIFVGVSGLFSGILVLCYSLQSAVITMVCFIVIATCCAGIANITTNHIPLYYRDRFDAGTMAGIGQGFCYIGSTLSTYTLGYVADKGGWFNVFLMLAVVIIATCSMCVFAKLFTYVRHRHNS